MQRARTRTDACDLPRKVSEEGSSMGPLASTTLLRIPIPARKSPLTSPAAMAEAASMCRPTDGTGDRSG